ncbi:hypothetical protein JW848_04635 [Candidatus Bipolaricaulota bacterium]|nr:hypothetical protein [Candidatus Bipolaricaulota bacterium]
MRVRKRYTAILFAVLIAACAGVAAAADVDFDPSTFNPGIGETVTLALCQGCLGADVAQVEWDLDGDGRFETEAAGQRAVDAQYTTSGYVEVTVRVTDLAGRRASKTKGLYVGAAPLVAARTQIVDRDGSIYVLVMITAQRTISSPVVAEMAPNGYMMEIVDSSGALVKREGDRYVALWMEMLYESEMRTLAYRLYPAGGPTSTTFDGLVSSYTAGERFEAPVCGEVFIDEP